MIGAWAMVLLYDYHQGRDFAAHGGVHQSFDYLVVHRGNVDRYERLLMQRLNALDVSHYSKVLNPRPGPYRFDLADLGNASKPAEMRFFPRRMLQDAMLHPKLILALTVLVVLMVAFCAYFVIERERERTERQLNERATQLADLLVASLAQPLWNVDRRAIDRQLGILARYPEVAELSLVADEYGPFATAAGPLAKAPGGRAVRVLPIEYSAFEGLPIHRIGEIRVVLSRAMADESIGRFTRDVAEAMARVIPARA